MDFNFAGILLAATLASGLIVLVDKIFWSAKRKAFLETSYSSVSKEPILVEYARSFFPVLLFVLVLRSFIVEPFRIPSGSMEPTLNTGDFILVNKFTYGLRFPVTNTVLIKNNTPERGDVVVFRYPVNPGIDFIKRVVGIPGDRIVYKGKELFINDEKVPKKYVNNINFVDSNGRTISMTEWVEELGTTHHIYNRLSHDREISITVPDHHYFVMGDNRDDSDDSRSWGFVPQENLVGQAFGIWFSWDHHAPMGLSKVRWDRVGTAIE